MAIYHNPNGAATLTVRVLLYLGPESETIASRHANEDELVDVEEKIEAVAASGDVTTGAIGLAYQVSK
jgi:hypothetical protein